MKIRTLAAKAAGVTAVGALLAGSAMTAAVAATPQPPVGTYTMSQVTNLTPFTWTFAPHAGAWNNYDVPPPQTLAPGQTASWAAHDVNNMWRAFYYEFNDASGNPHTVELEDMSYGGNGDAQTLYSSSNDGTGASAQESTASFFMRGDADGLKRHVDAVWTKGFDGTIDASKDPTAAATIVNAILPQAHDVSWTPDSDTPKFASSTTKEQASSVLENDSSAEAIIGHGQETSVGESTEIGEEVTASISTKIFGVAAKAAVSVTSDQGWGQSDSIKVTDDAPIGPHKTGYLTKEFDPATLTGTLVMTSPQGAHWTITNVSISRGDLADPNSDGPGGMIFSATQWDNGTPPPAAITTKTR